MSQFVTYAISMFIILLTEIFNVPHHALYNLKLLKWITDANSSKLMHNSLSKQLVMKVQERDVQRGYKYVTTCHN